MKDHQYWTYMMANHSRTLYTGMTNDLERRVWEHKHGEAKGFTKKYRLTKLVWYEDFRDVRDAIAIEKRIKGWSRAKKIALIESINPGWEDLSDGWYAGIVPQN